MDQELIDAAHASGEAACAVARWQHFSVWNDIIAAILIHIRIIPLFQSMNVYLKINCAKFHPIPIWNDEALGFLRRLPQQQEQQQDK